MSRVGRRWSSTVLRIGYQAAHNSVWQADDIRTQSALTVIIERDLALVNAELVATGGAFHVYAVLLNNKQIVLTVSAVNQDFLRLAKRNPGVLLSVHRYHNFSVGAGPKQRLYKEQQNCREQYAAHKK